jgi:plastocyanin
MTRIYAPLAPLALLFSVVILGCGGDGNGGTPPATKTIAKPSTNSGDAQSGSVGQPLASPLQVVVTQDGAPLAGEAVAWSTTAANGSVTASSTTDANGIASSAWTLGTVSGSQSAQATLSGASGSPVSFTATAAPGPATALAKAGGDGQNGVINTQLAAAVQAKASDQFGNGVAGIAVAWGATGATVSAPSVPTNSAGISAVNVTLGGTAGPITIVATADGLAGSPQTFTATAGTAPTTATISVVNDAFSPSTITVAVGTTVTWSWGSGAIGHNVAPDAVGGEPPRSGNLESAPNSYQHTFNTAGTFLYHCEAHGAAGGIGMSGTVIVQ